MKILIVDDNQAIRFALKELLMNEGYDVELSASAEEALEVLRQRSVDISIVDYQLPGMNGLELVGMIKREYSHIQVIFITAFGNVETALTAIKNGAYDYVAKPFDNDELLNRINHIRESLTVKTEEFNRNFGYYFSNASRSIIEKIRTISITDVPVLITGESGTGKELIARLTHYYSGRTGKFIAVNCSSLPPTIIESELFGAEKGSYTGSYKTKIGFFEQADNGTIFLDEIGEMPVELQVKLLRALQEGEIYRIGSSTPLKINSRVIAATNINIEEEVRNRKFREDLFYRLNGIRIKMPPLRERKAEIGLLSQMFLKEFNKKYNKNILGFDEEAADLCRIYEWPGNIRELKSKVEESVIFCNSQWITSINIFPEKNGIEPHEMANETMQEKTAELIINNIEGLPHKIIDAKKIINEFFEKEFISYYLKKNDWKIARVSEEIGMFRQDLYKKIKKLKLKQ